MQLRSIASLAAFLSFVALFAPSASAQPAYAAEYAGRSFPEADEKLTLTVGETREGYFELTNVGTATWSTTTTKLATIPRDAKSPLFDEDSWENRARCATVDAETPPGEVGRFTFSIRGNEPGDYLYAFGMVEEAVVWFADDGGPPDNSIFMRVRVVEPPPPTATVVAASASSGGDGGGGAGGGGGGAGAVGDGSTGGCDCNVSSGHDRAAIGWFSVAGLVAIVMRRRGAFRASASR